MKKQKKYLLINEYQKIIHQSPLVLVMHYNNLVNNYVTLDMLKEQLVTYIQKDCINSNAVVFLKVIKNNLLKHAVHHSLYKHMTPLFCGPTIILHSPEASIELVQKIIMWKTSLNHLYFIGGKFGDNYLSAADISSIQSLSTKKENILFETISLLENILNNTIMTVGSTNTTLCQTLNLCNK